MKKLLITAGLLALALAGCGENFEWLPADGTTGGSTYTEKVYDAGNLKNGTAENPNKTNNPNYAYYISTQYNSNPVISFQAAKQSTCTVETNVRFVEVYDNSGIFAKKLRTSCSEEIAIDLASTCKDCPQTN